MCRKQVSGVWSRLIESRGYECGSTSAQDMLHHESTYESKEVISRTKGLLVPLSSAHTQAAAYLIGETAAEEIAAEYNNDR